MYPTIEPSPFATSSPERSSAVRSGLDVEGGSRRSAAESECISAMLDYKQSSGRMFPTWSEVLEVAQNLGYVKPVGARTTAGG